MARIYEHPKQSQSVSQITHMRSKSHEMCPHECVAERLINKKQGGRRTLQTDREPQVEVHQQLPIARARKESRESSAANALIAGVMSSECDRIYSYRLKP